jgi:hypothetical protein
LTHVWLLDVRCRQEYLAKEGSAHAWQAPERWVMTAPAAFSLRGPFHWHCVELPMVAHSLSFTGFKRLLNSPAKDVTMSSARLQSASVDKARQLISREFARLLNAGNYLVRVRIVRIGDEPAEAWFYAHHDNDWHKESGGITDRALVLALVETLEMLATKEHADEWSARKRASADYHDTEVKFHSDKLKSRLGGKLESALAGLLFRDAHDSKKDKRRAIRTPRAGRKSVR